MSSEQIISTEYSEIMQKNYIDYAMSVIVARALPDIRDGLKPVQRRTLYDMGELGIRHDRPYRKCARIVGDTMGKYHPHGDSSIYEALVVMAQDFKKGQVLIDGHGNFGSIEGDGAAAMRYTEARLQKITEDAFLSELDKDTVDFIPNFDETEKEPEVLPVLIPNFLINGSEGIAVGMTTSTPPHNLKEVIEAEIAQIKNPDIELSELLQIVQGPDFPTGGIVVNKDDLYEIYRTGEGKIRLRGKVVIEDAKGGKQNLVVTEIPYTMSGSGIAKFMSDVAGLIESRKTDDITDISNQSDKEGVRIVIELRKNADPENIKNLLYQKTRLEDTFGVNMLSVSGGRPETMGLKSVLSSHIAFLYDINTRKYTSLLKKDRDRSEIEEGLIRAVDVIDIIIAALRGARSKADALHCLITGDTSNIKFRNAEFELMAQNFSFSEKQANAILDMRLHRLIGLEIEALIKEHADTLKRIADYEDILSHAESMKRTIINDLSKFVKEYGKDRKTAIENAETAVFEEKPIEETDVYFLLDRFGYAKTIDVTAFERNMEAAVEENRFCIKVKNTGRILMFTPEGILHSLKVMDVPHGRFRDKGKPVDNISNFDSMKETVLYLDSLENVVKNKFLFITASGSGKIVDGSEFDVQKRVVSATSLTNGDSLILISPVDMNLRQILLQTVKGFFLRFALEEIPEKKKGAVGVRTMKLSEGDRIEQVYLMNYADERTFEYKGFELPLTYVKTTHRDTKGTKIRV